jgi:hypothetical protein
MQRLEDVSDDEVCSECYLSSVQLQLNLPVPHGRYNLYEFNSLKESCGIPISSYPVDPGPTITATTTLSPTPS